MGSNAAPPQQPQHFCLRWNNHRSNLLTVFDELLQNEAFTDVTLACDGGSTKCHKMVLAACSSYFQELFTDLPYPCTHPVVVLKDVKYSEIKAILEYMYRGEVNVAQDQLAALLKVAEQLKVKGKFILNFSEHPNNPFRRYLETFFGIIAPVRNQDYCFGTEVFWKKYRYLKNFWVPYHFLAKFAGVPSERAYLKIVKIPSTTDRVGGWMGTMASAKKTFQSLPAIFRDLFRCYCPSSVTGLFFFGGVLEKYLYFKNFWDPYHFMAKLAGVPF